MKEICAKYEFRPVEQRVCSTYTVHGYPLEMGHGLNWVKVVYDRNLVSVSATETKIKSRYWFRGQNFFCLNLNFPPF